VSQRHLAGAARQRTIGGGARRWSEKVFSIYRRTPTGQRVSRLLNHTTFMLVYIFEALSRWFERAGLPPRSSLDFQDQVCSSGALSRMTSAPLQGGPGGGQAPQSSPPAPAVARPSPRRPLGSRGAQPFRPARSGGTGAPLSFGPSRTARTTVDRSLLRGGHSLEVLSRPARDERMPPPRAPRTTTQLSASIGLEGGRSGSPSLAWSADREARRLSTNLPRPRAKKMDQMPRCDHHRLWGP